MRSNQLMSLGQLTTAELQRIGERMAKPVPPPPPPKCSICDDLGFVSHDVPKDHPDFGRAFPCECQKQAIARRAIEKIAKGNTVLEPYRDLDWQSFTERCKGNLSGKQAAFEAAIAFADPGELARAAGSKAIQQHGLSVAEPIK